MSDTASIADQRRFRPEIEGLRAVAAILVAVYHVFLGRVSGGVDVFFVVSGFLITITLLGHIRRNGGVAPGTFLSRLASRLLPASMLVLVVVLAASIAWLAITRLRPVLTEIAASALYVENWLLATQQVDYLARGAALSPVQHFWALSIQGQFYLIWLALFGTIAFVVRRTGRSVFPVAAGLLVVAFGVSLAVSVLITAENQPFAYFHTGARVWEFAAGGLLALTIHRLTVLRRLPEAAGVAAGWVGLAMIVSCGVLIPVSTMFPGWVALWPVVGGLLVMLAGDAPGAHRWWSSTRMLASRPLVFLGSVSYAIYLWHWPILVLYRSRTDWQPVALVPGLLIIGLAILLAIATTYLVERPVRDGLLSRLRPWPTVVDGTATMVLVAGVAFGSWRVVVPRQAMAVEIDARSHPGAAAMEPGFGALPDVPILPTPLKAQKDYPVVVKGDCHVGLVPEGREADWTSLYRRTLTSTECQFGNPDAGQVVVLVGGSHAAQWFTALEVVATERGWHLISTTKSGCRLGETPRFLNEEGKSCVAWNSAAVRELVELRPDLVVTTATVTGPSGEGIDKGAVAAWRALGEAGIQVAAIRDNPRWPSSPVDCLAIHGSEPDQCQVARSWSVAAVDPTTQMADAPGNVTFIDLNNYLCDGDRCPAVVGNIVANYDANHLSASIVRTIAPMLGARLPELDSNS